MRSVVEALALPHLPNSKVARTNGLREPDLRLGYASEHGAGKQTVPRGTVLRRAHTGAAVSERGASEGGVTTLRTDCWCMQLI